MGRSNQTSAGCQGCFQARIWGGFLHKMLQMAAGVWRAADGGLRGAFTHAKSREPCGTEAFQFASFGTPARRAADGGLLGAPPLRGPLCTPPGRPRWGFRTSPFPRGSLQGFSVFRRFARAARLLLRELPSLRSGDLPARRAMPSEAEAPIAGQLDMEISARAWIGWQIGMEMSGRTLSGWQAGMKISGRTFIGGRVKWIYKAGLWGVVRFKWKYPIAFEW